MIERAPAMTRICRQAVRLFVWAVVALVCAGAVARAQDDGEPVEQVEAIPQASRARAERARQLIRMNNKVIERRLVRTGIGSAEALEKRLETRIRELNDLCRLTEPQVKKLHLAGRGDIKRYTDRLDSLVKRTTENDSGADSKLGLEMHDLEKTRRSEERRVGKECQ